MKGITRMASIFALALVVLALPAVASAQWRDRDRDDDYYGRNDDYRNGRYNNYSNLRGVIERLRNRARNLESRIDRVDDRYGSRRVNRLEDLTDRFARATDNLSDAYGRGRNLNGSRDEARRVVDLGSQLENEIYRSGGDMSGRGRGRGMSNQFGQISRDLRIIADAYGLGYGRNRSGDWRNRVPFPLPF